MRVRAIVVACLALLINVTLAGENKLYVTSVDVPSKTGKPLKMTFEELDRGPRISLIRVTHESGASVPSIMFVTRGMWEIARARGTPFFITLKEWTDEKEHWMYKVGFARDDKVDIRSYFGEEPPADAEWSSVKEYEPLFGK